MKKRTCFLGVIYSPPGLFVDVEDRVKAAREYLLRKKPAKIDDHAEQQEKHDGR